MHRSPNTRASGRLQIALKSNFLDASYCLLYGDLPSSEQSRVWRAAVMREAQLPLPIVNAIEALPADAHPMSLVMAGVVALGALHPEQNPALAGQSIYSSKEVQDAQIVRLLGMVPTIAAYAYHRWGPAAHRSVHAIDLPHCRYRPLDDGRACRHAGGRPTAPNERLEYAENFLYMLDACGSTAYRPHPAYARALDVLFTLHAEHEMNCSTAAVRHLASSGVDVYTAVSGARLAVHPSSRSIRVCRQRECLRTPCLRD